MSKRKFGVPAADSPSPREIVCTLVVDAIIDDIEVDICCQRSDGVDRVFATSMDWLRAERPSEDTLACSVEALLFSIIARCRRYIGEPVDIRAGLLSRQHLWAIVSSVGLDMDEIKNENELLRGSKLISRAVHLGLALHASQFSRGIWIACCPGTNHTLELRPKRDLFYCGACKIGGCIDDLDGFVAQRRNTAAGFAETRTLH
jgi:hypothetical protein